MTIEQIMDTIRDLPPQFAFILALITILGTSGFFTGLFAVVKLYAQADTSKQEAESKAKLERELTELRMRLEPLELERLRTQNEGKQIEAMNGNMKNLIDVLATRDDRWQGVFDKKSERQLEAEKLQHETNKMFIAAVNKQTETVANISEMLEILSDHFGGFGRVMQHFEGKLDATVQTVEMTARDNRSDLTTALEMNVTHRTENESNLRSILQAIDSVRTDVKYILTQSETQRNQTLSSMDAKFKLIEQRLTEFINPRPALLGMPETDKPPSDDEEENRPDEVA